MTADMLMGKRGDKNIDTHREGRSQFNNMERFPDNCKALYPSQKKRHKQKDSRQILNFVKHL